MVQEEKQLLLKDLCARLPYRVTIKDTYSGHYGRLVEIGSIFAYFISELNSNTLDVQLCHVKPYLRPMSSMTEKEKKYISERCGFSIAGPIRNECELIMPVLAADWLIDFYNEHHLDYRGLIPMGLALEAKEGMYKIDFPELEENGFNPVLEGKLLAVEADDISVFDTSSDSKKDE